jgi:hypothetical protein
MAYLKLKFIPEESVVNGLVIYSKKLITPTQKGAAKTDLIKGQSVYLLPGIRNKYKVYIK